MVIFLILFLEVIINFFNLSNLLGIKKELIYDKNGSHYLTPNTSGKVFGVKIFTDDNGFRIPESNFKYKGKKNIYIMGDSTSFGPGVKEEDTFVGLLRSKNLNVNFYNNSVLGYQINNHIINLDMINQFGAVDKIIYFYTLNDVFKSTNVVDANERKKNISEGTFALREIKILNFINKYLREKSYLYLYIKGIATDPSKRWYLSINNYYEKNDINYMVSELEKIQNFSEKINAEFLIVVLPYEFQTRKCLLKNLTPQKKMVKIFLDLNVKYLDLTDSFCKLRKPSNYFLKFDPMHLSSKGHKFVYNLIQDETNF